MNSAPKGSASQAYAARAPVWQGCCMDTARMLLPFDVADVPPEQLAAAQEAGLRYVMDEEPGFARLPFGEWFEYYDERGRQIEDDATIERIDRLAIPPAYSDVWICPDPRGHL